MKNSESWVVWPAWANKSWVSSEGVLGRSGEWGMSYRTAPALQVQAPPEAWADQGDNHGDCASSSPQHAAGSSDVSRTSLAICSTGFHFVVFYDRRYNPAMFCVLAAYLHRIDPIAIPFPDGWPIDGVRWYGLSYLAGFAAAYVLLRRVAKVGRTTLKREYIGDMVVTLAIGAVVGGRLGYVLFYSPDLLWTFSRSAPWWNLLAINKGGMASHGGMIGCAVASLYYAKRHQHSWLHLMDLVAFSAPLGLLFGRLANFINGELFGRPCDPDFALASQFPQEIGRYNLDQLGALDSAVGAANLDAGFWRDSVETLRAAAEQHHLTVDQWRLLGEQAMLSMSQFDAYQYVNGVIDKLMFTVTGSGETAEQTAQQLALVLTPRHPSQLYQAALEGAALLAAMLFTYRKPRKPLIAGSVFLIAYSIARIIGEQFREPDQQIGYEALHLTRGQWLSVAMFAVGAVLAWRSCRRTADRLGGWMR